jgi:hypothetical protein
MERILYRFFHQRIPGRLIFQFFRLIVHIEEVVFIWPLRLFGVQLEKPAESARDYETARLVQDILKTGPGKVFHRAVELVSVLLGFAFYMIVTTIFRGEDWN